MQADLFFCCPDPTPNATSIEGRAPIRRKVYIDEEFHSGGLQGERFFLCKPGEIG